MPNNSPCLDAGTFKLFSHNSLDTCTHLGKAGFSAYLPQQLTEVKTDLGEVAGQVIWRRLRTTEGSIYVKNTYLDRLFLKHSLVISCNKVEASVTGHMPTHKEWN